MIAQTHWRLAAAALVLFASMAVAGARMFLVPKGMDPAIAVPGENVILDTGGGEQLVFEVYVEWSPLELHAFGFAVTMPCGATFSSSGYLENATPPLVDEAHSLFFFPPGHPHFIVADEGTCGPPPGFTGTPPRWSSSECIGGCPSVPNSGARYVGEIGYATSANAEGSATLSPRPFDESFLISESWSAILPLSTDGVEIRVTHGRCCAAEDACAEMTRFECNLIEGLFAEGESCAGLACGPIRLIGSDPPNCAIDARQPHAINDPEIRFGWNHVDLLFNGGSESLSADHLEVIEIGGDGVPPQIAAVDPIGLGENRVQLASAIEPGAWTCIRHVASDTQTCVAALPGDVNGDRTAGPVDVLRLIDALNGVVNPPLELWQTDIDRSGAATPADILRVIDLLNGAQAFDPWLLVSLPVCPG